MKSLWTGRAAAPQKNEEGPRASECKDEDMLPKTQASFPPKQANPEAIDATCRFQIRLCHTVNPLWQIRKRSLSRRLWEWIGATEHLLGGCAGAGLLALQLAPVRGQWGLHGSQRSMRGPLER